MQTILQFIGLFLLLILSFFGANYMLNGDIILSGGISLTLVILMYFLIEFLKKRKVQITKSKFSTGSILGWVLFAVLCIPSGLLIVHSLNVEINAKKDLQGYANNIVTKNQEIINLFQTENKQYISDTYLIARNALDSYVNSSNETVRDSIKTMLATRRFGIENLQEIDKNNFTNSAVALQSALEIRSGNFLDSVSDRSARVIENNAYLVENWSRLRVVTSLQELENMLEKNLNQLNKFLAAENYKTNVFSNPNDASNVVLAVLTDENNQLKIVKANSNLASFSELWRQYTPYGLIIPALIFFFLLILPYMLEKTAGTYVGGVDEPIEGDGYEI